MDELIGAIVNLFSPAFWVFLISLVVAAPFLVGAVKDWREPPPPKPPTPPTFVERCLDGFFIGLLRLLAFLFVTSFRARTLIVTREVLA
jgi:hypothetical protein